MTIEPHKKNLPQLKKHDDYLNVKYLKGSIEPQMCAFTKVAFTHQILLLKYSHFFHKNQQFRIHQGITGSGHNKKIRVRLATPFIRTK